MTVFLAQVEVLRPTFAPRNYPTLAFKSHNATPIGPDFDGTNGEYLNGVARVRRDLRRCNSFGLFIFCNGQAGECSLWLFERCGSSRWCATRRKRCIGQSLHWQFHRWHSFDVQSLSPGYDEGGIETASGELYDRMAWTAAIQTDLRETFGGIRYGKDYRPTYALVEVAEKRAIIKINDVGPLKPGRVIDFNEQTMRYFDPSLQRGIIHSVKVTPLPDDGWATGPING